MEMTFGHVVFSKIYGLLWRLARPVLRRNKRLADGFTHRLVPEHWAEPAELWLQAASAGEAYLAWEYLLALKEEDPTLQRVLVTTWTRQGLEVLHGMRTTLLERYPDMHIQTAFFPLDQPNLQYRALKLVQPKGVVLLETELWPGLLFACRRCGIPVGIVNARMTEKSVRGYQWINRLCSFFWEVVRPCSITAIDIVSAERYAALFGWECVEMIPNIKFDRAVRDLDFDTQHEQIQTLATLLPTKDIVLLASTREEEEQSLLNLIGKLRSQKPDICIVLVPRHMQRIHPWLERFAPLNNGNNNTVPVRLRSALTAADPARNGDIVLWDAFGELSALYNLATTVFVGGSLAPLGGQNFLESLAGGRIPHVGPHLENFLWALDVNADADSLIDKNLIVQTQHVDELAVKMLQNIEHPADPNVVRQQFLEWLTPRRGGSLASVRLLRSAFSVFFKKQDVNKEHVATNSVKS